MGDARAAWPAHRRNAPVADQSRPTIFRFGERRILKPWSAGLKAEKNPASEFVIVGGQSNMLDRDMDVAKASIDATTLVDSASAGRGVDEVDCACAGFACKGAGQPDRGALRERRCLACRDFNPLLMDGLDQKRTGGTNHCFRTAYLGLGRGLVAQQRRRSYRRLRASKFDKGVDGCTRDAEGHRSEGESEKANDRHPVESAGLRALRDERRHAVRTRHREIFDAEIVTAGAAHAADPPSVYYFHRRGRKEHEAHFGHAARQTPRPCFVMDDAIADRPHTVCDAAAVAPAT